jgi:hypothetical protein
MIRSMLRWLSIAATAAAVTVAGLLVPADANAGVPAASAACVPAASAASFVRAEVVDRWGRPSGQFVDSRCPDRTLRVRLSSRFHYLRHSGMSEPGSVMTFVYVRSDAGQSVHSDVAVARRNGAFRTGVVDLTGFMSRRDALTVTAHHQAPTPTILQDLIEYALLAGFVAIAP